MSESKTPENNPAPPSIQATEEISVLHPTVIQEGHTSNDFTLILADHFPVLNRPNTDDPTLAGQEIVLPVGVIKMSPQTAKDLFLLMKKGIQQYESQYGPINTTYSQALDEAGE